MRSSVSRENYAQPTSRDSILHLRIAKGLPLRRIPSPRACPALGQPQWVAPTVIYETDPLPHSLATWHGLLGSDAAACRRPHLKTPRPALWQVLIKSTTTISSQGWKDTI